ncbi:MAG: Inner membrane transport permease YbhS [Syntrophorhabdaceae bacterium PtaU1.Bin034]|nr:MAG: Inner membrane transport permease YbhS [Syntrophorhabdaceae bacterium PtaU1.Bin034]
MRLLRVRAIARKEWIQIKRDPLSLALAFALPAILLLIYGYAISFDVDKISTVVYDADKSSISRELVAEFRESGYFNIVSYIDSYPEIDRHVDAGDAKVALVIPVDFSKNVRIARTGSVEAIIDGSDANTATIAQGYITAIASRFGDRLEIARITPRIDLRNRVWYNPELKSRNFIIPGLIAIIMSVIISLLTSLTVAREWDRGTMEQLISTPVKPAELILGKLTPYFLIGLADTILSLVMSTILFKVPLRGSISLLLVISCIFLFGGLCFGILLSIVARNQLMASQAAMLTSFLPAFLLSGFIFSISNMPVPLQPITYVVPARYFVSCLKAIFLKGTGLRFLSVEIILLSLYAVAVFVLANKKLRKRID